MQNKASCLLISQIIRQDIDIARNFFSMLQPTDIIVLMLLNSDIYHSIKNNVSILNRLFYNRRLQIEKSIYFDFQIDGIYSQQHLKQMMERIATDTLNFSLEVRTLKLLQNQLLRNLKGYIQDLQAQDHLEAIRGFMRQPELPIPGLQKENVGEHCNTSIQMLITTQAVQQKIQPFDQEYCDLRKQIIENADQIVSFFVDGNNHELLKNLRYNPELVNQYIPTNLHFINIIQLLILIVTVYLNSIRKLLDECSLVWKPYEFFLQFSLRYSVFRNTICALEDRYGFLFKHFNEAFCAQFKQYPSMPCFSFWRTALKIWSKTMSKFHTSNKKVFSELLLLQIQTITSYTVDEYISNPQSPNNSITQCEYRKSNGVTCQSIQVLSIQQRESLYSVYQQYLIDISANQFNIHWCGSSQQRLHGPYLQTQLQILVTTKKYWQQLQNTFSSPVIIKKISSQVIKTLQQRLKPTTFTKVQNQMIQCLENIREKILGENNQSFKEVVSSWKKSKVNTTKLDGWIKYIAEQRGLKQQSGEKYKMYFDTNQHIDLKQLQKQIQCLRKQIAQGNDEGIKPVVHSKKVLQSAQKVEEQNQSSA